MKPLTKDEKGINILSFGKCYLIFSRLDPDPIIIDAGSPGGVLSQMYILAELMRRMEHELRSEETLLPSDCFDVIGGSGIGASVLFLRLYFREQARRC